nr:unnamed protein product [Callosobruchus chinensis]
MGDHTVSNIVQEVALAIWNNMQPIYLPEPTTKIWESIASRFEQRWQFPHCVGAVDGKHVVIKKPNKADLPHLKQLPTIDESLPYVFVGDEAFPLSINLMRPYPRTHVTGNYEHQVFNARLSQARQTAECAFGILSARFRVFKRPFENKEDTVKDVVKAACVLHNYLLPSVIMENVNDTEKRSKTQLLHVQGSTMRTSSAAFRVRQNFTTYFKNWGAVPWQHQSVLLGKY